jgi:xylulokinase
MSYYLGIDIGTYESKGVLTNIDGDVIASAATPHEMIVPQPGWAEHRAKEDWWHDVVKLCRELLAVSGVDAGAIRAVACSAIGPCMLPVDATGEPLTNGILYGVDGRSAREIDELTDEIGESVLIAKCGNALTTQSIGPKILWLKNNRPAEYANAEKILTSTSYVVHQLTGEYVIDHYTAANFSPLYRVAERDWSTELTSRIIGTDKLPRLHWSCDIAGEVTPLAAEQTGLAVGTPVTTGTIDAAAEALSVGVIEPGNMMIMYGSTIFTIMPTEERVNDPRLWYAPWLFENEHASMAGLATSGTLTHWFRDQLARDLDKATAFAVLTEEASASPPGANGLVFLPYFSGERTPIHDPYAKGCFFGLNLKHTRADMYRAVLEGVAFSTRHIIDTYRDIGHSPRQLFAVGGGTKNRIWSQATSDASGYDQTLRKQTIGASYGDAFIAALAVGDVKRDDILNWNPTAATIKCERRTVYDSQFDVFVKLYENTKALMWALESDAVNS